VLKNQVKPLLCIASLAKYSQVLTLACDVVQMRKTWSCITMMVPTLKLHPSLVTILVLSIINGTSVDADLPSVLLYFCFRPTGP
jgi:hypothetical protein